MLWRLFGEHISRIGREYVRPNHIYFTAQLPNALMFRQYASDSESRPSPTPLITNMEKKFINQENVLNNASGEEAPDEEREKSIRHMKYTLLGLTGAFVAFGSFIFITYGAPPKDEKGQIVIDEFSNLPLWKQYFFRGISQVRQFAAFLQEPSREKLLPDPLAYPFFQPPYTLVLEFTDVLAHPEWTYQTGWRFKKRPGVDHLLENLSGSYEIVVFTHEPGITVFPLIDALDNRGIISFKLVRDATHFIDGHHVKNLDKLNRDLKKVIMIDWDTRSVKFHAENHFVIDRWEGKDEDNTLVDLTYFLKTIAETNIDDVRDVLKFYKQFDDPLTVFKQKQMEQFKNPQEILAAKNSKGIVRRFFEVFF